MYRIDRDFSYPPFSSLRKFPIYEMEVGESFQVPGDQERSVRTAIYKYGKRTGKVFSVRKMRDLTIRCWRLE